MELFNSLSVSQQSMIERHLDLIIEANKNINLTRIQTKEEAMVLHIEDSLTALPELEGAPPGRYGDLGSGAGYPGIPLAIASGRDTVLIDSREKKMIVLSEIIEEIGLKEKVKVFSGRAELLARKEPASFSVLTARAVAKLPVLLELASPLLMKGGRLICYKANVENSEYDSAKAVRNATGMKLIDKREFLLNDEYKRTIVAFEKYKKPSLSLPRKEGEAQKHPLSSS